MKEETVRDARYMTSQAIIIGAGLFILLSVIIYVVFPTIHKQELVALHARIDHIEALVNEHNTRPAHNEAIREFDAVFARITSLETLAMVDHPEWKPSPLFVPEDSLLIPHGHEHE